MDHENSPKTSIVKWLSIDESMKNLKYPYRFLGLNFQDRKRKFSQNFMFWLNMVWMNLALVGCFQWTYEGLSNGIDLTEITYVAPGATLSIIGDFKGSYLFIYESLIIELIAKLRNLEENVDFTKVNDEEVKKIRLEIKFLNLVIKILNILNIMMLLVYDLTPIVLIAMAYHRTHKLELMLPFLDIYPFDSLDLRFWPFMYMHQVWSEAIVLMQVCGSDYLFYICCTHIKIQFRLLQIEIENVISKNENEEGNPVELQKKIVRLVKWHQELISAAQQLELITSKSTLCNFLMSSVVICLTGFNVTTTDDANAIMTFMTFLFMSMLQVFFLCLFGDMLISSSSAISDAVYNSQWYMYLSDSSTSKGILLIQTRAQSPCKVTAFGFADVNLRAYMRILSTSWSYFALLKTVYGTDLS